MLAPPCSIQPDAPSSPVLCARTGADFEKLHSRRARSSFFTYDIIGPREKRLFYRISLDCTTRLEKSPVTPTSGRTPFNPQASFNLETLLSLKTPLSVNTPLVLHVVRISFGGIILRIVQGRIRGDSDCKERNCQVHLCTCINA